MKAKSMLIHSEEEVEIFNKKFGVIFNGEDNLRPLLVESLIDNAPTASQCADIYESFIAGGGFEVDMSDVNLLADNHQKFTPNDLLSDIAESLSRHQAVFILVGYNANFQKDHFKVIPYQLGRVGEKDSQDYYGKILISPKGWGKSLKKEQIDIFDVYNPRPEVIAEQVIAAGGWDYYKGQILHFKLNNKGTYGKSLIERAYRFADAEMKVGMFFQGLSSRGFEDITIIRHRKFDNKQDERDFNDNVKKLSGLENTSSKMVIEDDWDDEREKSGNFKFDTIKNDSKPEKYAHMQDSSANYIRKAFKNIPTQLVDYISGKLGNSSGEDLKVAQSIYNQSTAKDREKLSVLFAELFNNFRTAINPSGSWKIKQYSILDDGTIDTQQQTQDQLAQSEILKAQATLRGSVGGVDAILNIQKSVADGTTTYDSGVAMLQNIFGYPEETAKKILGAPKAQPVQPQIPPTNG